MKTRTEGMLCIFGEDGSLRGVVWKDSLTRKNIFFSVSEMSLEEIAQMLENNDIKVKGIDQTDQTI